MRYFYPLATVFLFLFFFLFTKVKSAYSESKEFLDNSKPSIEKVEEPIQTKKSEILSNSISQAFSVPTEKKSSEQNTLNLTKDPPRLTYLVNRISFQYGGDSADLPPLESLKKAIVPLSGLEEPVSIASLMEKDGDPFRLSLSDFHQLAQVALLYLKSAGYEGVVAFPNPSQIDPLTGSDLRPGKKGDLQFIIWVSRLQEVKIRNLDLSAGLADRIQFSMDAENQRRSWLGQSLRQESFRFWKRYESIPGISSRILLVPGDRPGTVRALLEAKQKESPNTSLSLSNAGTETLGKWIWGVSYQDAAFSDFGDKFSVHHIRSNTGARRSTSFSYSRPLVLPNIWETGLSFGISEYDASSFAITRIDFAGRTKFADWLLRWNPLETEAGPYDVSFEVGLRAEELQASNSLLSGQANANFLTPRAAILLRTKGKYLRTISKLQVSGNTQTIDSSDLSLLGGVQVKDRPNRLLFDHQESFRVGKWLTDSFPDIFESPWQKHLLISRARLDYGLEKVRHLPQRQFIAGGTGSVRGYPESPAAGDDGIFISSEYRIPLPKFETKQELGSATGSLIPFVDWAETKVNQPLSYESDRTLLGAGVGLEMKFSSGLFTRLDFATPLREIENSGTILEGTQKNDHRVHALFQWEF